MKEALSFEQKVQGLVAYHKVLLDIDPHHKGHIEVANPEFFSKLGAPSVSSSLAKARHSVLSYLENHGRQEYDVRGFAAMDLREDTEEIRKQRADVLSVMTAPLDQLTREERGKRISGVLAGIVEGQTLHVSEYDSHQGCYQSAQEIAADTSRPLFGLFVSGLITERVLTIQYDNPVTLAPGNNVIVGNQLVGIDIHALFWARQQKLVMNTAT
ncbi:MAG: hypothetical protein JWM81_353 [Candidatus Saccharibacteria bacterium]|nr:hypothetical protein [Candidatus Saccharibacteria bacterium]